MVVHSWKRYFILRRCSAPGIPGTAVQPAPPCSCPVWQARYQQGFLATNGSDLPAAGHAEESACNTPMHTRRHTQGSRHCQCCFICDAPIKHNHGSRNHQLCSGCNTHIHAGKHNQEDRRCQAWSACDACIMHNRGIYKRQLWSDRGPCTFASNIQSSLNGGRAGLGRVADGRPTATCRLCLIVIMSA